MRLSRLLIMIATLALTCASVQAHVGAFSAAAESARRDFLPDLATASRLIERVTAGRVWENYDCARDAASGSCVDAFGVEIGRSGTTGVEHLYRGERWDANVAMYDLRARLYSPSNGRFLTQDSFVGFNQDPQSLHKYAFNHNDPVNRIDPSGHLSLIEVTTSQNIQAMVKIYNVGSFAVDLYTGGLAGGARAVAEEIVFGKLSKFRPIAKMSDEVLGLFSKVWSRGVNLKLGLRYNSDHLRHNMEQVFGKLPADHAPHHIVPSTSPAMKKLRDFGIDPNSPSNGVALPKLKDSGSLSAQHSGGHCRKYYDLVERLVSSANTKEDVVNVLALVRVELLSGAALVQGCT